jgi:hypothetical protein
VITVIGQFRDGARRQRIHRVHGRAVSRRRLLGLTGALVVVLAAWNNLVVTRLPGYPASSSP